MLGARDAGGAVRVGRQYQDCIRAVIIQHQCPLAILSGLLDSSFPRELIALQSSRIGYDRSSARDAMARRMYDTS